jgi:uracil-DNA glycosylase family 4
MSHGCDSQDFTSVLGPLPIEGRAVDAPILFLLEEPGGDWESGQKIRFRACLKQPPNYHYYWSPGGHIWPTSLADLGDNFYGTYFAYLMRKHGLRNVYITNVVKCRWVAAADDARRDKSPIVEHCTQRFLAREVTILKPRLVLCFGNDALAESQEVRRHCAPQCRVGTLLHPSYIQYRCQTHGRTKQDCLDINDSRVCEALTDIT